MKHPKCKIHRDSKKAASWLSGAGGKGGLGETAEGGGSLCPHQPSRNRAEAGTPGHTQWVQHWGGGGPKRNRQGAGQAPQGSAPRASWAAGKEEQPTRGWGRPCPSDWTQVPWQISGVMAGLGLQLTFSMLRAFI